MRISEVSSRSIAARRTHATRTVSKWHSREQDRLKIEPWFAKSARDPRRALIVFSERKSAEAAQRLFDLSTSAQRATGDIPIWASKFKVHTFSSVGAFWAYVEAQAKDQADVKSVLDAMNDSKDTKLRAQFQRVEDQFAKAKKDLEEETLKAEKTVAQVTSVCLYHISCIQSSDTLNDIYQKHLGDKTAKQVRELKMLLAGLEIRAKAAEEKVIKNRQAIVVERAQIAKLEAELAERQENERRHELLQLVTKYKAKVSLGSGAPEKKAAQKLLLNDVCSLFFYEQH